MKAKPRSGDIVMAATGRSSPMEAIRWIAEGHPVREGTRSSELLRALLDHSESTDEARAAIRRIARLASESSIDPASSLFDTEAITTTHQFREALSGLAAKCENTSLGYVTASSVIAAQRSNPLTIEALCATAGIAYADLTGRVPGLPLDSRARWSPSQVEAAFSLIDDFVQGRVTSALPGAIPARALEFVPEIGLGKDGWHFVEELRTHGVPYELLLAQRSAGGAWLAHRNRTSSRLAPLIADRLCLELDERGVHYRRAKSIGGAASPAELSAESGCDKQVGLLALNGDGKPTVAVIFSIARDSGTASKSASRLRAMIRPEEFPVAVVVSGPGWSVRNETADLAVDFGGLLYSDRSLPELADMVLIRTNIREEKPNGNV